MCFSQFFIDVYSICLIKNLQYLHDIYFSKQCCQEHWKIESISNFLLFAGIYLISIRTTIFLKLKDYYRCHWNMTIVPAVDFHICASKSIILLCDHIYFTLWCLQIWNRHQQDESRDHHFFSFPCVSIQPIRNHLTLSHG